MNAPIFLLTGTPGAGKTSVSARLLQRYPRGYHLQVDDLRTWVVSGMSDSVDWTDETERQFRIAEVAACRVAETYSDNGFAVVIDHCRNLSRWQQIITEELKGRLLVPVLLLPSVETALERNRTRSNKGFDTAILEDIIRHVDAEYRKGTDGWLVIDSSELNIDQTVDLIEAEAKRLSETRC